MKQKLRLWTAALAGVFAISSCAYDPYYSSAGASYGYGHGYGGSSFSTSVFVSTGDPRWGYDPHTYAYYDYTSRRYYDPYLYGYYPVGYRPPIVVGVPHPHGWRPGRAYCPPPTRVRNVVLPNYRNRESSYRSSNHSWARQVRERSGPSRDFTPPQRQDQRRDFHPGNRNTPDRRNNDRSDFRRTPPAAPSLRDHQTAPRPPAFQPGVRQRGDDRRPNFNAPVTTRPDSGRGSRSDFRQERSRDFQRPAPAPRMQEPRREVRPPQRVEQNRPSPPQGRQFQRGGERGGGDRGGERRGSR